MARKICLVTGSRAEYGHLRWLAREIADDPDLRLQWLVTGSHLMERFGLTHQEIEDDGFVIDVKVEMPLDDDSAGAIVRSLGEGVIGMSDALERLTPDIVVILGDRYEMLVSWIRSSWHLRRPSEFIRLGAGRAVMLEHHKRRATTPGGSEGRPSGRFSRPLGASGRLADAKASPAPPFLPSEREKRS